MLCWVLFLFGPVFPHYYEGRKIELGRWVGSKEPHGVCETDGPCRQSFIGEREERKGRNKGSAELHGKRERKSVCVRERYAERGRRGRSRWNSICHLKGQSKATQ